MKINTEFPRKEVLLNVLFRADDFLVKAHSSETPIIEIIRARECIDKAITLLEAKLVD